MKAKILTPLRYPGGKSRAINKILKYCIPSEWEEYREPFVGGGSLALYLKQLYPDKKFWINDIYYNLYCFWTILQSDPDKLIQKLLKLKKDNSNVQSPNSKEAKEKGKDLFLLMKNNINEYDGVFDRAVAFYVLNKTSYSGLSEFSSYSHTAFLGNFTISNINRLKVISEILQGTKITNLDYSELLEDNENIFIYHDPPYKLKDTFLYGRKGELHSKFDHERFYNSITESKSKWLITYNYTEELYKEFNKFNRKIWNANYTMQWKEDNEIKTAKTKSELLIYNYDLPQLKIKK